MTCHSVCLLFINFFFAVPLLQCWEIWGFLKNTGPVPVVARSEARTVFDRSKTGIVGSNPAGGMGVCPRFSVLYCPV
jgi:hypothetical protein